MSQKNVEMVERGVAAYNARDIEAIYALATADFEWIPAILVSVEGGSFRGRSGMEAYFKEVNETWEDYSLAIDEFRGLGERVLVLGRLEARGRSSGIDVDTPWAAIFEFRGERMCRVRAYLDHHDALRAAGMAE